MMANLLAKGVSPALAAGSGSGAGGELGRCTDEREKSVEKKTKKTKEPDEKTILRERAPVEADCQCMARVWGNKQTGFGVRGLAEQSDSDFCPFRTSRLWTVRMR